MELRAGENGINVLESGELREYRVKGLSSEIIWRDDSKLSDLMGRDDGESPLQQRNTSTEIRGTLP